MYIQLPRSRPDKGAEGYLVQYVHTKKIEKNKQVNKKGCVTLSSVVHWIIIFCLASVLKVQVYVPGLLEISVCVLLILFDFMHVYIVQYQPWSERRSF